MDRPCRKLTTSDPKYFIKLEDIYFGAKVELPILNGNVEVMELKNFRLRALEFYVELCQQIKKRFNFENPVLQFISNFNPKNALSGEVNSIVAGSMTHFPNLVTDIEKLNSEWRLIASCDELKVKSEKILEEFWSYAFDLKNNLGVVMFPSLNNFVKGILCLPHSSASAEKFSLSLIF
ncbi:hypothetical protein NQ314_016668 [Rhamnusium bicolor]|uniref:Uncharacterized protein n=1 Tax=Rhamnusium bicolor TaxID=1586634 RepID=A0AAV8WY24_9CUCU|nr:hypothetical protein NQ314_016668 [Rhamnusium bicolor]